MEINFIPMELRPKRASRTPYLIVALVYIFVLLFFGTQYISVDKLKARIEEKEILLVSLKDNLIKHTHAPDELKAVIKEGLGLVKRGDNLRRIKQSNVSWTSILSEIDRLASIKLYFEEFDFDSSAPEIRLIGFCRGEFADTDILEFVSGLQESSHLKELFREIKLVSLGPAEGRKDIKRCEIIMSFRKSE